MMSKAEMRWVVGVTIALVIASTLPYLAAWVLAPQDAHFTGILFNPQDGQTYLAKMRQGLEGSWRFHLAYTPEPQEGARVFLFHLLLGHVARWTGLPLAVVYHLARALGGGGMLLAIYALAARLTDDVRERRAMFGLAALGSGLGWLAGPLGLMTADLWVPEAFPVYALLANAHFPLAIGLMACVAVCGLRVSAEGDRAWRWGAGMALAALALGVVQPFGLVPAFGGLGVMLAARAVRERAVSWRAVGWVALAGLLALPYPLYMLRALAADPILAAWSAQNVTASPPLWDWALSYGLVLALAGVGAVVAGRRGADADWLLLGWAGVTLVGMYLPLPLQRRLSLGLGVPLGLLAGLGWRRVRLRVRRPRRRGLAQGLLIAFCVLTPLFLIAGHLLTAPDFYLSDAEWSALAWLREQGHPEGVVLCAPRTGLFVPAWAGQPVVYGHPFETVDAERREAQVRAYWAFQMTPAEEVAFLQENRVRYVWIGPRERALEGAGLRTVALREPVFEAGDVAIYEVSP